MKALIISADHFEDTELLVPYYRLKEAGFEVDVASISRGKINGKHGYEVSVGKALRDVQAKDYDILVIPGGKAPSALRKMPVALEIVKEFILSNKPVSAICHGPQLLITAGVIKGRRATGYHSIAEELKEAGVLYEDSEVVVDGNLITSRQPSDLPAFMRETIRIASKIVH
jgi:protease I